MELAEEYLTDEQWKTEIESRKANTLKNLILGPGDDGLLSALSGIFSNRFSGQTGVNKRVVPVDEFVNYLVKAGFADNPDEARQKVLPTMDSRRMCYKCEGDLSYSISVHKVRDSTGNIAYKLQRYIG
ncbi:MAG: hypothetical protein AABY22_07770 [Nanoarchaeota archaeon]